MITYRKWAAWLLLACLLFTTVAPMGSSTAQAASPSDPFTWDNANVYFVMTDRFYDGNSSNNSSYGRPTTDASGSQIGTFHGGDIKGLTKKLQEGYFSKLGTNAIWITAPYEQVHGFVGGGSGGDFAHYAYHGYYALDYTSMDKNMGTVEEMREFVDQAHAKGIRVVLDVVMNHPGYSTLKDMEEYNFGKRLNGLNSSWKPTSGQTWHSYHDNIDYTDSQAWAGWWSGGWVRAGIGGYPAGGNSDLTLTLSGLPDFRTEVTTNQGLAPVLQTKWSKEGNSNAWVIPAASSLRKDLGISPTDYNIRWLSAWVEEFGIDGFRVDTAKHVDQFRWKQLKNEANTALQKWRQNNPTKAGANWKDSFWMTGEVWGQGVSRNSYYDNGFDSLINFSFQDSNLTDLEGLFSNYASKINTDPGFNVLSYISSHDTKLYDRNALFQAGTALLLAPGGIQTYYGDESARPFGATGSDAQQGTRSDMNWSSTNADLLAHWQKLGQFRYNHPSIGAGAHKQLASAPYTFSRTYNNAAKGINDSVVIATGASGSTAVTVSPVFADGTSVRDAYTGATTVVSGGKATFTAGSRGVILIEQAGPVSTEPAVSASPAGGSFTTDGVKVTLSASNSTVNRYTVNGTTPTASTGTAFASGDAITIGSGLAVGQSVTLKLFAGSGDKSATASYTFTRAEQPAEPTGLTIHFKKPADWSTPQLYYYETTPVVTGPSWASAPAMTDEGDGWYRYTIPAVTSARVIFKDATHQLPGASQPGLLRSKEGWYDGTTWYDQKPAAAAQQVTFKVTVPSNTTASDTVYVASSLNNWNPADSSSQLTRQSDGTYTLTLTTPPGTAISYKLTRGSWNSVETAANGADITNRTYTVATGSQTVNATIARWKDR